MFRNTIAPLRLDVLSIQQSLELTNVYLENAYKTKDKDVALVLCHDAEVALTQAKNATKKNETQPKDSGDQGLRKDVAAAYIDLGKIWESQGYQKEANALFKKAEKWGGNAQDPGRLARTSVPNCIVHLNKGDQDSTVGSSAGNLPHKQPRDIATIPPTIFAVNVGLPTSEIKLPESDERLTNTPQLACCLGLLQASRSNDEILEPIAC
ncbi:hypothetical protein BGZ65_010143, partial [Modicella reniformis]